MRRTLLAALAFLAASALPAQADAVAGYLGAVLTPVVGLPATLTPTELGATTDGPGAAVNYAHLQLVRGNPFAGDAVGGTAGYTMGQGRVTVSGTVGHSFWSCPDELGVNQCSGIWSAGASAVGRLGSYRVTEDETTAALVFSAAARAGVAWPSHGTLSAWSLELPIAMPTPVGGVQVVPSLTPGVVWGRVSGTFPDVGSQVFAADTVSRTGSRFLLRGSLAIVGLRSGLGASISVRKVFIANGAMQYGLGLSWSAR